MDQQKKQCITHYIGIFFKIAQAHQAYICRFCSRCIGPDLASIMAIGLLILRKKLQCYRKRCSHCISPGLEPIIAMGLLILPNKLQGCSSFHACCSYGAFRSVQKKKTMRSLRHHSVVQFVTAITQDIHMMIVSEIHQQFVGAVTHDIPMTIVPQLREEKHAKLQAQKAPGRNHYTPSMLMPRKIGSGIECSSNSSSCPHWPRNYYLRIKLKGSTVSSNSTWVY